MPVYIRPLFCRGVGLKAARRISRVLRNDPATGIMRHADAGYEIAIDCTREKGLDLPALDGAARA